MVASCSTAKWIETVARLIPPAYWRSRTLLGDAIEDARDGDMSRVELAGQHQHLDEIPASFIEAGRRCPVSILFAVASCLTANRMETIGAHDSHSCWRFRTIQYGVPADVRHSDMSRVPFNDQTAM